MPSLRLLFYSALSLFFIQLASAHPAGACPPKSTPTLPVNGGGTELPAPVGSLKIVTVGRGVQNYSCSAGAGTAPVAVGAIATLFDLTRLAKKDETALHEVPPSIVYQPVPTAKKGGKSQLYVPGHGTFPLIGHHYFAADGTPVFDLSEQKDILYAKKVATVNAPPNANAGPAGTGAVPWLKLVDKGGSVGVSEVYRVVTAGGKAPVTCRDTKLISVEYAAEYWFYG